MTDRFEGLVDCTDSGLSRIFRPRHSRLLEPIKAAMVSQPKPPHGEEQCFLTVEGLKSVLGPDCLATATR